MHIVTFAGQSRPPDNFSPPNPPTKKTSTPANVKTEVSPSTVLREVRRNSNTNGQRL